MAAREVYTCLKTRAERLASLVRNVHCSITIVLGYVGGIAGVVCMYRKPSKRIPDYILRSIRLFFEIVAAITFFAKLSNIFFTFS